MSISLFYRAFVALLLTTALAQAAPSPEHPSVKRGFSLPPSADLTYAIKARQHGLSFSGEALTMWRAGAGKYALASATRVSLFGKILDYKSEGAVDDYGLAPLQYQEQRMRKDASITTFKRDSKTIVFSDSEASYPLKGGEQDRNTAAWQLLALARAAPEKFIPGSDWAMFVAGPRDAEVWSFKVIKLETVQTGLGELKALHVVKAPPPDAQGQQVDLWLAPALDWYPVKVHFVDSDGDFVEQTLQKIEKK